MELWKYYRALRRRAGVCAIVAVVVLIVAGTALSFKQSNYRAVLRVFTAPPMGVLSNRKNSPNRSMMQTFIRLTASEPVLSATIKKLNLPTRVQELEQQILVSQETGTDIMRIQVSDSSYRQAKAIADTVGVELKKLVDTLNKREALEAKAFLQRRIQEVEHKMVESKKELNEFTANELTADSSISTRSLVEPVRSGSMSLDGSLPGITGNLAGKIASLKQDRDMMAFRTKQVEEELKYARQALASTKPIEASETGRVETAEYQALKSELSQIKVSIANGRASGRTDDHPDIKRLLGQDQQLELQVQQLEKSGRSTTSHSIESPNPIYQDLVRKIQNLNASMTAFRAQTNLLDGMIKNELTKLPTAPGKDVRQRKLTVEVMAREREFLDTYGDLQKTKNMEMLAKEVGTLTVLGRGALVYGGPIEGIIKGLMFAIVAAAGAGLGVGLGLEFIDNRVRTPQHVEQLLGLPILGIIPASTAYPAHWSRRKRGAWFRDITRSLPARYAPRLPAGESD